MNGGKAISNLQFQFFFDPKSQQEITRSEIRASRRELFFLNAQSKDEENNCET